MILMSSGGGDANLTDSALLGLANDHGAILQQLSEGVIIAGLDGRLLFVNHAAERLHGVKALDVRPDAYSETYHLLTMDGEPYPFEDLPLSRAVMNGETVEDARWRIRRPDGSEVVAIGSARPLVENGRKIGAILNVRDDTERFEAERQLRLSEERNRLILDSATDYAIFTTSPDRVITSWSRGASAVFGYSADEAIGMVSDILWVSEDRERGQPEKEVETALASGCAEDIRWHRRRDGGRVFLNGSAHPLPLDEKGNERGIIKIARDDTENRAALEATRESEAQLRLALDSAVSAFYAVDLTGNTTLVSRGFLNMMEIGHESEAVGKKLHPIIHHTHPDGSHYAVEQCPIYQCAATGAPAHVPEELFFRPDGSEVPVEYWVAPIVRDGERVGAICTILDLTDRKAAEDALRRRSEEFHTLADNIPALAWMAHADGNIFWYNRRWYEFTGTVPEDQAGWGWESVHHPEVLPTVVEQWTACLKEGKPFEMTFPLKGISGEYRPFLTRAVPIRDDQGRVVRWFGTNVDVSEQVEAEQALTRLNETLETRVQEEVALRAEAEEALRQSQKMETLGQLTGGIAHDFNNLLQIITGNLDILRRTIPTESARLQRSVHNALKGAERAAILTQRLLAFSRRQPLVPKVFDPNKLVTGMSDLLFRAIGETVAVETVLGSGLWRVEADANQLENALLNLAVNARDAMPGGGKITIETANTHLDRSYAERNISVVPGQYVVICVCDTGLGMDAATAERAFDPFFTTKEVGKGTGLGLSMVYGFVRQSGGHLKIHSQQGEGTTVKIYLPRHHGEETESEKDEPRGVIPDAAYHGNEGETILVCEDDDDVRAYSAQSLSELGYRVIEASDGESALRLLESTEGGVDLLFTDIVLPGGMTGAVVAERARAIQPGLKVLFTTGYARNSIVHHGRVDPGVELLSKPFSYADLAARVRTLLDAPAKATT